MMASGSRFDSRRDKAVAEESQASFHYHGMDIKGGSFSLLTNRALKNERGEKTATPLGRALSL